MALTIKLSKTYYKTNNNNLQEKGEIKMAEFTNTLNKVDIVGVIKEHKLNQGETVDKDTKKKQNYINGSVVVKCGESREVEVKVYAKEFNKKNEPNKKYNTLLSIINGETLTLANAKEEDAHKVSIWGSDNFVPQLKDNFYAKDGKIRESIEIDLGFGNLTVKEPHTIKPEDYKALFEVNTYVYDVQPELNKEEQPTGRAKIITYVPAYGGKVIPLTMYAGVIVDEQGEYDFGADVLAGVFPGDTVEFWGELSFQKTKVETIREGRSIGGRGKTETKTVNKQEFVVTGGTVIEDQDKMFVQEDIQEAVKQREIAQGEAIKNEGQGKSNQNEQKGRGNLGGNRPAPTPAPTPQANSNRPRF